MSRSLPAYAIASVAKFLINEQKNIDQDKEEDRLAAWAQSAKPNDHTRIVVPCFGLTRFQYMRMLFGGCAVKPDANVIRYLQNVLNRRFTRIRAVDILERAAEIAGINACWLHATIQKQGTKDPPQSRGLNLGICLALTPNIESQQAELSPHEPTQ